MSKKIKEADSTEKMLNVAKEVVDAVIDRMNELGVTELGPVYIENCYSQTHGTQQRLHLYSDDNKADLVFCRKADNDHETWYEFGDFNLPYVLPDIETVLEFLDSVDEINDAIEDILGRIKEAEEKEYKIK